MWIDPSGKFAIPLIGKFIKAVLSIIGVGAVGYACTQMAIIIAEEAAPGANPSAPRTTPAPATAPTPALTVPIAPTMSRQQAIELEREWRENGDTVIFRSGSGNATNFTPRPGEAALSFYRVMPSSGYFTMTTIGAVNATGVLRATIDRANHVSVFPTNPATLQGWQNSRPTALENPHPYTLILQVISRRVR